MTKQLAADVTLPPPPYEIPSEVLHAQETQSSVASSGVEPIAPASVRLVELSSLALGKELGRGSFGVVREGKLDGTAVAVKTLHLEELNRKEKRSLQQEVDIMARLGSHPNLMGFLAYCEKPPALVMELVPNGSLAYLLHYCEERELEAAMADGRIKKRIACGIVSGLQQLHACDIVHGDIKPANGVCFVRVCVV